MVAQSSSTSTPKPSAPFPYMSSLAESFCRSCGVLLLFHSFPGTVRLLLVSDWGKTFVHWHCKQKAAALCLYEVQTHIKYEGSLSTQINFVETTLLHPILQTKEESLGKKSILVNNSLDSAISIKLLLFVGYQNCQNRARKVALLHHKSPSAVQGEAGPSRYSLQTHR